MPPIPILISAGEASGDMYAARLAVALRQRADVELFGMGGAHMRSAGVDVVTDYSQVSVVGITEILSHLPSLVRAMRTLVSAAKQRKPRFAILTDFPGFHLRLARKLLPLGVRNIYYICPQFWAWRPWRVNLVRRRFAKALCIFPFEEAFFSRAGVPTEFIGHPLVGAVAATKGRAAFFAENKLDPALPLVAILPGSRAGELVQHLPVIREACRLIANKITTQFVIAAAHTKDVAALSANWPTDIAIRVVDSQTYDALAAADAAIVSSGTATVEAALLDAAMVVIYRVTPLTALLAKPLVRTQFFSMVNLIADRGVVTELIQDDLTAQRLADEIVRLLTNSQARANLRSGLAEVRRRLGTPGAVERAADAIVALLHHDAGNAL